MISSEIGQRGLASGPGFAPVMLRADDAAEVRVEHGIVIELRGAAVRIAANVSPSLASAVVRSLAR